MSIELLISFLASFVATALVIVSSRLHGSATLDSTSGPQKFHVLPTPRIGGVGIVLSVVLSTFLVYLFPNLFHAESDRVSKELFTLLGCSSIVFIAGLCEDLTKRVGVSLRLGAGIISGVLALEFAGARLIRLDVWFLDTLLQWEWFSFLLTAFAVAGIANAVNIIDGYNGLSGGYAVLALTAISVVAYTVGDARILGGSVIGIGAIAGFLVWNFPFGRIFLGDAGAYFIGFMIAEWSVLLVARHPTVSPWFPLMVVAYPVWETLFSIYRKSCLRKISPGQPDGLHFHMLIYKRVVRWRMTSNDIHSRVLRNSLTSPYLWALSGLSVAIAIMFWNNSIVLAILAFAFGALYNALYRMIVRFRVPHWLTVRARDDKRP